MLCGEEEMSILLGPYDKGDTSKNGGNDEEGCGYNGNKQGQSGNGGNGGGSGAPRFTFSSNGNVS